MSPAPESTPARGRLWGMAAIFLAWVVWSFDPIIVCGVGAGVPRLALAGLGALFGGLVFAWPLAGLVRRWRELPARHRWLLVLQAVFFTAVTEACYVTALRHLNAGVVSGVLRTQVAFAVVFAVIFLGERLSLLAAAGILTIFAANAGLLAAALLAPEAGPAGESSALGWVLAFLAALMWSGGTVAGKELLKGLRPAELAGFRMSLAGVLLLAASLVVDGPGALGQLGGRQWLLLALKGVLTSGLAFLLYYSGLRRLEVYVASAFEPLAPMLTLLTAFFLLDQAPQPAELAAVAALLAGTLMVILAAWRKRGGAPPAGDSRGNPAD